jgi:hypothetical protein
MDWQDIVRGLSPDPRPTDKKTARPRRSLVLDAVHPDAPLVLDSSVHERQAIALEAIAALQQWLEDDDLEPGETHADRLLTLVVGIADSSQDGEIDDDEAEVIETFTGPDFGLEPDAVAPRKVLTLPQLEKILKREGKAIPDGFTTQSESSTTRLVRAENATEVVEPTPAKAKALAEKLMRL